MYAQRNIVSFETIKEPNEEFSYYTKECIIREIVEEEDTESKFELEIKINYVKTDETKDTIIKIVPLTLYESACIFSELVAENGNTELAFEYIKEIESRESK